MSDTLDWNEIARAKKMAKTSDHSLCGNVIAEYRDNIIVVEEFGANLRGYMIPKSRVKSYDGRDIYLNIPRSLLSSFDF
ncbi:MAG: hypothetical protein JO327_03990 [Nitrososphaeraceae archaeon]|nr:hypothetical protein [Nitrososphaeraceae archaeon]MBV9667273.1 hypothetical protein [Nitrososphaeraceae archaeon]